MAAPYAGPYAAELVANARALCARGKGLLAADESTATVGKRLASVGVENTEEQRRALREMLLSTPGCERHLSGVILFEETLGQATADGTPFVELLRRTGLLPGIKLDTGVQPLPGGAPGETRTCGLDTLAVRAGDAYAAGARFAKWRAVLSVQPTPLATQEAAQGLALYAVVCQSCGLVPVLEPEVLAEGAHSLEACAAATEAVLKALFTACAEHGVLLEGTLLKPNMVIPGPDAPPASPQQVAQATLELLRRCVPAAVPGILFLSGGQSEAVASANLDAIVRAAGGPGGAPWALSFSYGRALQASALKAWAGQPANVAAAQAVFLRRCAANGAAALGQYAGEEGA